MVLGEDKGRVHELWLEGVNHVLGVIINILVNILTYPADVTPMFVPLITLSLVALSAATKCSLRKHNAVDHTAQVPFATSLPPPKSSQVTVATSTASNPPSPTAFDYSRTKVRGVNLYVYRYPD